MAQARRPYPVIQPNVPGTFLMPQLFRFGRADNKTWITLVWVQGGGPGRCLPNSVVPGYPTGLALRFTELLKTPMLTLLRDELELEGAFLRQEREGISISFVVIHSGAFVC